MNNVVWIRASVEQMNATVEFTPIDRETWEAMSEKEQDGLLTELALEVMSNNGGCGASVVDEADVPEEWRES